MISPETRPNHHHAHAGPPRDVGPDGNGHFVRFYQRDDSLCDAVADFLEAGLASEQPVIVFCTHERQTALRERMAAAGRDVDNACRSGEIRFHDAHTLLGRFMSGGTPDRHRFNDAIGGAIEESRRGRDRAPIRAYGEMVDVLWRDGNANGAIMVEELWNELADTYPLTLLCAYAMGNFFREGDTDAFRRICDLHHRVIPAELGVRGNDADGRARMISLLQQRALALESEVEQRRRLELALRDTLRQRSHAHDALRLLKEEAERANRVKSEFLAVMSHELRTPLNAIIGYDDILESGLGGPVTDEQKVFLGRIRNSARQLLHLIDQVLDMSRIEAGVQEVDIAPVDANAVAIETGDMIEHQAQSKGLSVIVDVPQRPTMMETDAGKLRQILLNLLSNAVKFTANGNVRLSVIPTADGWTVFEVTDTGAGIADGDRDRIFEPFVQADASPTRRHGGTGLGLSVSRDLARLIGGDITVSSTPGRGSTFTLALPAKAGSAPLP